MNLNKITKNTVMIFLSFGLTASQSFSRDMNICGVDAINISPIDMSEVGEKDGVIRQMANGEAAALNKKYGLDCIDEIDTCSSPEYKRADGGLIIAEISNLELVFARIVFQGDDDPKHYFTQRYRGNPECEWSSMESIQ